MTIEEVKDRVKKIEATKDDVEDPHINEDNLYSDFIAWIASGDFTPQQAQEIAKEILKTNDIDFQRYYG